MKRLSLFFACLLIVLVGPASLAVASGHAARATAVAALARASSAHAVVRVNDQTGALEWLGGSWAAPAPGRPAESSYRFLEAHRAAFGIAAPREEFRTISVLNDDQLHGWRDVYLGQSVDGVPLLYSTLAFHYNAAGRLVGVNGAYTPTPTEAQTPRLSAPEAAAKAVAASATLPRSDGIAGEQPQLRGLPVVQLVYFKNVVGDLRLSYQVQLKGIGLEAWTVIVDARSGAILSRVSRVETAGSGIDLFGKRVGLKTSKVSGSWKLIDRSQYMFRHHSKHPYTTFEGCIEVRDAGHLMRNGEGVPKVNFPVVKDPNGDDFFNHGGTDPKKNQRSAVSLARNLSTTYKAFRSRLGRNSLDGKGLAVIGNVHLGVRYENAYWSDEAKMMYFGDNARGQAPFAKALDVVAHEYGHGVTRYSVAGGGFVYQYPSGALSEAFSDMWGSTVDYGDWLMGEDLGHVERNLADPAATGTPGSMWDYMVMVNELDGGGNHLNATIGGHFFQQLAAALPAVAPAADGRFTAARIVYRSYQYLTPQASYRDVALAASQAAVDLYGEGSPQVTATRDTLVRLGLASYDFGQNDSGWCTTLAGDLITQKWARSFNQCYVGEKFTRPDSAAQLARVYFALWPGADTMIAPGQALKVLVTGVAADGGPDFANVLDTESVTADGLVTLEGQFSPATMTSSGTPRVLTLPAQYFVLVGFDPGSSSANTLEILQDDGSMNPPADQNWVVSVQADQSTLVRQTLSSLTGTSDPHNFMIRPMYWYDTTPAVGALRGATGLPDFSAAAVD